MIAILNIANTIGEAMTEDTYRVHKSKTQFKDFETEVEATVYYEKLITDFKKGLKIVKIVEITP